MFINSKILHRFQSSDRAVVPNFLCMPDFISPEDSLIYSKYIQPIISSSLTFQVFYKEVSWQAKVLEIIKKIISVQNQETVRELATSALVQEIYDSATRRFTTGFYFGNPKEAGQDISREPVPRRYGFCGIVLERSNAEGLAKVEQRNKFSVGDRIDILSPNLEGAKFTLKEILDEELQPLSCAPHPQQQVYIRCPYPLRPGDLLRRKLD